MQSSAPLLDERLRRMLMLRAYNCRPRDWTLKEQFDAIAEDGMLTKNHLREALRLYDYPRIDTLVDYRLFHRPHVGVTGKPSVGSISVTDFIAFMNSGNFSVPRHFLRNANIASCRQQPSTPFSPIPLATTPSLENIKCQNRVPVSILIPARAPLTAAVVTDGPAVEADEKPTNNARVDLRGPNVVPITSRSTLSAAAAERGDAFKTVKKNNGGRGEEVEQRSELISCRQSSESVSGASLSIGREHTAATASVSGSTPCREIVRHLSTVMGLRGKDGYRRQPVWRKRETLVQERIVQYTTLDEKGTIQDLVETEKSQTEVLHMECKRTAEFAHRESTYYESGEAFNGEAIAEESGAEHYVHFRSVDDEYEFLESTLPPRARHGDATDAGNAGEGISGGGEDVTRAGARGDTKDDRGDYPAGVEGEPNEEEKGGEGARTDGTRRCGASSPSAGGNVKGDAAAVGLSARGESGVVDNASADENPSVNLGGRDGDCGGRVDDTIFAASWGGRIESGGELADGDQQYCSLFSPSAYHYRSPMCSPRLSPRPMRSPYRQEGVGRRETTERGNQGRSWSRGRGSELPVEVDADARGGTIPVEEKEASIDDPTGGYLGRPIRGEELEQRTGYFDKEQKLHTIEMQRPCAPGWPSVGLLEGHTPRRSADQERSRTQERKTDDGDFGSLGCDSVGLFAPFEARLEPGPPWAPPPDDTVVSGTDIDDSERMKRDRLLSGSGSGRGVCVPMKTCFDGHDGDLDHGVFTELISDRSGSRQRDDNSGSSRELEYSSAGDGGAYAGLPAGDTASP